MPFVNYPLREISCKIVYYGPGLCGKTTNVQAIYQRTDPAARGRLISLKTEAERTLFFDDLPLDVGRVRGFKLRLQLYTVPGQIMYKATRRIILRGVDALVFVADSQIQRFDANVLALEDLEENLAKQGRSLSHIPHVIQYNKRDLPEIAGVAELRAALNRYNAPDVEAAASAGDGVFDTLKAAARLALIELQRLDTQRQLAVEPAHFDGNFVQR
jgi:signal recognition particle receptor subunit beta